MYSQNEKQPKKEAKKPKLDISKLPASLKERYEAMGLLPKKPVVKVPIEVNLEKIKQRKINQEKSIEEKLEEVTITSTEKKALERYLSSRLRFRVFLLLSDGKQNFNAKDIATMLSNMGLVLTKSEIDLMLWVRCGM
jgi:hypothetical protein